jgi:hypothetical protein
MQQLTSLKNNCQQFIASRDPSVNSPKDLEQNTMSLMAAAFLCQNKEIQYNVNMRCNVRQQMGPLTSMTKGGKSIQQARDKSKSAKPQVIGTGGRI